MHLTLWFYALVVVVALSVLATWLYIKLDIEPNTERWRLFQDRLRGYRTQLVAGLVFLGGLTDAVDPGSIARLFGADSTPWLFALVGIVFFLLRQITTTPPGTARKE